jgi:hypothetical protein
MALQITRDQDTYNDYVQRSSSLGTGNYYWSVLIDYKWDNASSTARIIRLNNAGVYIEIYVDNSTGVCGLINNDFQTGSGTVTLTNGQWATFGIAYENAVATLYCCRDNGSDSTTTMPTIGTRSMTVIAPSAITLGSPETDGSRSARGSYSRLRYWNANESSAGAGNALLSASQFSTERTIWTPGSAKSAYCVGNWSLATDGSDTVGGLTLTSTGSPSYATDEPSYITSGSSIAPIAMANYRMRWA